MNNLSTVTSGLVPSGNSLATSLISSGASTDLPPIPVVPNSAENTVSVTTAAPAVLQTIPVTNDNDFVTVDDMVNTALPINDYGVVSKQPYQGQMSYTGSDLKVIIEVGDSNSNLGVRFAKELIEMTTLSVSVHRAKSAVNAAGFIGAKGYARGRRTIAGTMVLTQFTVDVLMKFLQSALMSDLSKDTIYVKVDQLPLFNLTLFFSNEFGYMSYQRLIGVNLLTTGTVYSTQDLITEQTIAYVASDLTPLLPLTKSGLYKMNNPSQQTATEKTPGSVLASGVQQ